MNLKQYYVIEMLYKLSQESDEIIEKLYTDTVLNNDYFEEVIREISEILNNKRKKEFTYDLEERGRIQTKEKSFLEPFFETKVTIHKKPNSKVVNEYSRSNSLNLQENFHGFSGLKMPPVFLSNESVPINNINWEIEPIIERNLSNKLCQLQKANDQRYSKSNSKSVCTSSNSRKLRNEKFMNNLEDSLELNPHSDESNLKTSQVEKTVVMAPSRESLCERKDIYLNKSKTSTNLKIRKAGKFYPDEFVENSDRSPDSVIILEKTCFVSSGSSVENNGHNASVSSTFVSSCDSGAFSFGSNEPNEHKNKITKMVKFNEGSEKKCSQTSFLIENPHDKAILKLTQTPVGATRDKTSCEDSLELNPNSDESNLKTSQVENTVVMAPYGDRLCERKDIYLNKSKTSTNLKIRKTGKIYLDEFVENSDRSPDSVIILEKTYVVSSGSSVENNDHSAYVSSTFVSSYDSSAFSFGSDEHNGHKNEITKMVKCNEGVAKECSQTSFLIENPHDQAILKLTQTPVGATRDKTSCEFKERLVHLKRQNAFKCEIKSSSMSNPSLEEKRKLLDTEPRMRYRLRSLENKSGDKHKPSTNMRVNGYTKSNIFDEKLSGSTTDLESYHFPDIKRNKNCRNFPANNYLSENTKRESGNCRSKLIIRRNTATGKGRTFISEFGGGKYNRNSKKEKNCSKQLYSLSAPVNKKRNTNRNLRPITPIELVYSNRESLKVKAEEKRRQREIRVQKTKERKERLEKEREEKIRVSQQRLKQRFQQHEEMLKQKIDKFKFKSPNRQKYCTKRSNASTSSKHRKDRTKDNDDFCRNSINSGQKLSKESNGYRDVFREKDSLASLEGDVGLHPEISKKQNAIPVGCEKTPVEFFVSCDGKNLKKFEKISAAENDVRLKDSKACGSDKESMTLNMDNSSSVEVPKKNKYVKWLNRGRKGENLNSKQNNYNIVLPNRMSNTNGCKKVKKSYLLRSDVKQKKRKNITAVLLLNDVNDKHNTFSPKLKNHKNINSSSETSEKGCSKLCFKTAVNRAKKKSKAPLCCKSVTSNGLSMKARKQKCILQRSRRSERIASKRKTSIEMQEIISYEIPNSADDSFEETIVDFRKIPRWATGIYLKQAIIQQHYDPSNVEEIFGILPTEPIDLAEFFGKDKPEYHRRTSSDNWSLNLTPL